MAKEKSKKTDGKKPGPEAELLKIEGDWKENVGKAIQKKRPADGWPKPDEKKK